MQRKRDYYTASVNLLDTHYGFSSLYNRDSSALYHMAIYHVAAAMAECEMHIVYWRYGAVMEGRVDAFLGTSAHRNKSILFIGSIYFAE